MTKQDYKIQSRATRLATFKDCRAFQRSIRPQARAARSLVLAMRETIAKDVAPVLDGLRQVDNFINSGKSLIAYLQQTTSEPALAPFKLAAPPLPVGLPMPPNVCRNPVKL